MPRKRKVPVVKRPPGRPRIQLDENKLRVLANMQGTLEEIAVVMGCSVDTLERHWMDEINAARANGRMSLRRLQWVAAQNGDRTMLVWLGKQWLGQRDQAIVEHRELPPIMVGLEEPPADE